MLRLLVLGLLVAICTATYDESQTLSRVRRQARDYALDLASKHDKPVGKIHGRFDLHGSGQNSKNFHAQGGLGLGSTLFRSKNKKHSIGAGVYAGQGRGRFHGFNYKTKPNYGAGLSYKYKFG